MTKDELGKLGEDTVYSLFDKNRYEVQSPDFVLYDRVTKETIWVEVKFKKKSFINMYSDKSIVGFSEGHGLNIKQMLLRTNIYKRENTRTYLMIIDKTANKIFGEYLDILEKGKYFDTPKEKIRIYDLSSYTLLKNGIDIK